ncbi:PREDICTED: uncharacterized protein LOC109217223 isoform X2 [Nicotiana attenuata]|uniref:uncharacterized protein LOC109217223 isoform X2 n=1 Tax=Nicotiana attenuata TaxID=49451 RepID=UPI000904A608|nr:PREDICTED: uncharacterized protein LOC109217223 isoform X2 [Nicotiana attenuata]
MTNNNDDDIDLGLALGCTTHNVKTETEDDSGAGVNASSTDHMAFAASNPLSELVWSPDKGLSLKCADSGLADKKPFLLWNVGLSNVISSPSQSSRFKGTYDENAVNERIIVSRERFLLDGVVDDKHNLAYYETNVMGSKCGNEVGCSSQVQIMNTADGVDTLGTNQDEESLKNTEKGICISQDIQIPQTVESSENHAGQGDLGTERSLQHGADSKLDTGTIEPLVEKMNQGISTNDKYRDGDVLISSQALIPTVKDLEADERLEFALEEDSGNRKKNSDAASLPAECIAENDVHLPGVKETCDQKEEQLLMDSSVPLEVSPTHSRSSSYRRKGKGKALFEGNADSKMSNGKEDSHESVESCNSTGLIPKGKKRWHFEQQSFIGSKRIRTHMHGDSAVESTVARNSSFMTWISNMVKGFSKSNLEESPILALTFTPNNNEENQGKETNHQEIVMYDKDHDPSSRSMGFQTVFQSLYCPTLKVAETEIPKDNNVLVEVPPISCHRGDNVTASAENKASSDIGCSKANDGLNSTDSLSRLKVIIGEENNTCRSSERDTVYGTPNRNHSLHSLWITRFSNRTPGTTVLNTDNPKPTAHETLTFSTECRRPNPQALTSVECVIEHQISGARETSSRDEDDDVAASSKEINQSNIHPIIPSAKFKKSEALASLFARRLDALKHIVPSSTRGEYTRTTCFFCGRSGHDLRNCSEVTESELEVLIRNIRAYNGAEESTCLCIRCFQLDHWAISCPTSSPNRNRSDNLQLFTGNECSSSFVEIKQSQRLELANHAYHSKNQRWFARTSGSNQIQKKRTSPLENSLKESIISSNLVSKEITDLPTGIFDVIRGLRLSRVDILKWMNSNTSLSHLDGLFLRLRLGKWEAGPEGTGYYVACITGVKGEKSERDSRNRISVNVGGVECFVGSQYVSNQDFLEKCRVNNKSLWSGPFPDPAHSGRLVHWAAHTLHQMMKVRLLS